MMRATQNDERKEKKMTRLTGKTFAWKNELKRAGFIWNADNKTWDREESLDPNGSFFEHIAIIRGIESGDLKYAGNSKQYSNANAYTSEVLYGANHE